MIKQANKSKSTKRYRKVYVFEILDTARWNEIKSRYNSHNESDDPSITSQAVSSPNMTKTMMRDIESLETGWVNYNGWGITELMLFDVENQEVVWHRKA